MRKETIKALESRRISIQNERRITKMKTLGATNDYGKTNGNGTTPAAVPPPRSHRSSNAGMSLKGVFDMPGNGGHINRAYEHDPSIASDPDDVDGGRTSVRLSNLRGGGQVKWQDPDNSAKGQRM